MVITNQLLHQLSYVGVRTYEVAGGLLGPHGPQEAHSNHGALSDASDRQNYHTGANALLLARAGVA